MSYAICFNLDQCKILSFGKELKQAKTQDVFVKHECPPKRPFFEKYNLDI